MAVILCFMTQKTFPDLNWEQKDKKTRRERFLGEMELAVPWKELVKLVKPVAPGVAARGGVGSDWRPRVLLRG
jgi:IS5 family transposase